MKPYILIRQGEKWRQLRSSTNLVVKPRTVISYMPKNNIVLHDFIQYLKEISDDKSEFQINEFEELIKPLNLECKLFFTIISKFLSLSI